jgi:glycosyltransferase involved in cell wall biosynthesis
MIAQKIQTTSPRDRIHWTGYLAAEQLSHYLSFADMIVLPYDDGASLRRTTLLNALAHRRPIISTGSIPPSAGVVVAPVCDAAALATSIKTLLNNPADLSTLDAQAAESAALFQWPTIAAQTLDLFKTLL